MPSLAVLAAVACGTFVLLLLWARTAGSPLAPWFKALASAGFVLTGFLLAPAGPVGWLLRGAFLASFAGDVLLGGPDQPRRLMAGAGGFALAHVLFIAAFLLAARGLGLAAAVLIVLILLAGGYAVARLAPAAGSFGGLVVGYGVAVTAMTCGASAAGLSRSAPGVVLGGLAFFASDLLVARGMFVRQDALNDRLGLPLYYAAQLALAFSAASLA